MNSTYQKLLLAGVALSGVSAGLFAAEPAAQPRTRGEYLVERIGLCADCHSARNQRGEIIRETHLRGAALPFAPTVPMPWAPAAPPIAGLPSMTTEQAVTFLTTGKRPDGTTPRPPMPEFRFSEADAREIVAYLKAFEAK